MKLLNAIQLHLAFLFLTVSIFPASFAQTSGKKIITGIVTDSKTGYPLGGTNVFIENTASGTITNKEGKYRIVTSLSVSRIVFSYLGYKTEYLNISGDTVQTIDIKMKLSSIALDEVKIKPLKKGYRNKNNPAVELIEEVIAKKSENRKEKYDYLQYKQYEKVEYALSNIKENFGKGRKNRKFRFVFDNTDTTKRIGNTILPLFISETLSDQYYRKEPESTKEIITAEKSVNLDKYFDNNGISAKLNYLYQNINIYDNEILFLKNKFVSPVANLAPLFYKYYIIDTLTVEDIKSIRLYFEPRNKSDFLFQGYIYIMPAKNYSIRKIDMGINRNINFDWIQNITITQDFEKFGDKGWLLSKEETAIDFGLLKNSVGLLGERTIALSNYKFNEPLDDKIFNGPRRKVRIIPLSDSEGFWESNRIIPLNKSEAGTYVMIDSINKIKAFKRWMNIIMMFPNDFLNLGKIEIGPEDNLFSFNPVEGTRLRFGGRTTTDYSRKLTFEGYVAYGLTDKLLKYNTAITYSLTSGTIYQFPVKSICISFQKDVSIPGDGLQFLEEDNFFASFKRGIDDKLLMNRSFKIEYLNEFENHFSILLAYNLNRQSTAGNLHFNTQDYLSSENNKSNLSISELNLSLRYAPGETFYQKRMYRRYYPGKYPVTEIKYAVGSKSMSNDYNYRRFQLDISKRFNVSILGYSDVSFEAGKINGKVSYPLLFMTRANQTYSYEKNSYNLMNFLEFVSDRYISINIDHCFNGFIFNKIPLVKKLKLREVLTYKVIYGGLSKTNNPDYQDDLFKFPVDSNSVPLTYPLEKKPYIEGSIGISNILKVFRIDLVKRFTYLYHPNVSDIGIRFLFELNI